MWQDNVIAIISIAFSFFLIPQAYYVYNGRIPISKVTAGCTAFGLLSMSFTYATLGLTYAAATTCLTAAIWGVMLFPKKRQNLTHH